MFSVFLGIFNDYASDMYSSFEISQSRNHTLSQHTSPCFLPNPVRLKQSQISRSLFPSYDSFYKFQKQLKPKTKTNITAPPSQQLTTTTILLMNLRNRSQQVLASTLLISPPPLNSFLSLSSISLCQSYSCRQSIRLRLQTLPLISWPSSKNRHWFYPSYQFQKFWTLGACFLIFLYSPTPSSSEQSMIFCELSSEMSRLTCSISYFFLCADIIRKASSDFRQLMSFSTAALGSFTWRWMVEPFRSYLLYRTLFYSNTFRVFSIMMKQILEMPAISTENRPQVRLISECGLLAMCSQYSGRILRNTSHYFQLMVLMTSLLSKLKKKKLPLAPRDSRAFWMLSPLESRFRVLDSCSEVRLSISRSETKTGSAQDQTLMVMALLSRSRTMF